VQQSKFVAASSAAKLRARQEDELKSMVAEQERRATEFEKLFDLVGGRWAAHAYPAPAWPTISKAWESLGFGMTAGG
jgi:hypothetical protein